MTVYLVAQLAFTDVAAYRRYQAKFRDVFRKFDGRLLAADEHPKVGEGHWGKDKIVIDVVSGRGRLSALCQFARIPGNFQGPQAGAETVSLIVNGIPGG